VILAPDRVWELYYRVTGTFEVLVFTPESVTRAFYRTAERLDRGLRLAGRGVDFSRQRMDFRLYVQVDRPLSLAQFNQVFLEECSRAEPFPVSRLYSVHFVSARPVEAAPAPPTGLHPERYAKWLLMGLALIYLAPLVRELIRRSS